MSTKFDHIRLSRAFRPHVLATIKALPGWAGYAADNGFTGRTETMTTPEIRLACENLGLDLDALFVAFHGANAPLGRDAGDGARDNDTTAEGEDSMTAAKTEGDGDGGAYEGRDVDEVIGETLASASAHLTPYLAQMLPGLIRPLVEAAAAGPRVVREIETVTVTVGADGVASAPAAPAKPVTPDARRKSAAPLWAAFGMRRSDATAPYRHAWEHVAVPVCDYRAAPDVDDDYVWDADILAQLAAQDVSGLNAWVYGPAGVGKTVGIEQYAARLARPFVRIAIERTTEPTDLIGQMVLARGGGMVWQDGKLTAALRMPWAVVLIDEPSLLRSGTLAVIMTVLDTRRLWLASGEAVNVADGVFIVCADNTSGCGDDTGRYVDTAPLSAAFMDRFALRTEFSFLSPGREVQMLAARAGIHVAAARPMVEYAGLTRQQSDAGKLSIGVTPRRLIAWARAARAGIASAKAFNSTVIAGAAPEDRATLITIESVNLRSQHERIDAIVRGILDPDAPVATDPAAQGPVGPVGAAYPDDDTVR